MVWFLNKALCKSKGKQPKCSYAPSWAAIKLAEEIPKKQILVPGKKNIKSIKYSHRLVLVQPYLCNYHCNQQQFSRKKMRLGIWQQR